MIIVLSGFSHKYLRKNEKISRLLSRQNCIGRMISCEKEKIFIYVRMGVGKGGTRKVEKMMGESNMVTSTGKAIQK